MRSNWHDTCCLLQIPNTAMVGKSFLWQMGNCGLNTCLWFILSLRTVSFSALQCLKQEGSLRDWLRSLRVSTLKKKILSPNSRTSELLLVITLEKEMPLEVKGWTGKERAAKDPRGPGCFEPELAQGMDVSGFPLQPLCHRTRGTHFLYLQNGIGYTWCLSQLLWKWMDLSGIDLFIAASPRLNQDVMRGEFQMLTIPFCYHFSLRLPLLWQPRVWMESWDGSLLSPSLPLLSSPPCLFLPLMKTAFYQGEILCIYLRVIGYFLLPRYCTSSKHNQRSSAWKYEKCLSNGPRKARSL